MIFVNSYTSFPVGVPVSVEYPPSTLVSGVSGANPYTTTQSAQAYGNGLYTISASSEFISNNDTTTRAYAAFSKGITPTWDGWSSSTTPYNTSTGAYIPGPFTTVIPSTSTTIRGEWLQIIMPTAITLTSYSIQAINPSVANYFRRAPRAWVLVGSNDGTNWVQVDSRVDVVYSSNGQDLPFNVSGAAPYTFYRLVITSIQQSSPDGHVHLGEMRFFGY